MLYSSDVLSRLCILLGVNSDQKLSEQLGVSRPTVTNWRSRNSIPYEICSRIAIELNISLDWLLLGREFYPMPVTSLSSTSLSYGRHSKLKNTAKPNDDFILIELQPTHRKKPSENSLPFKRQWLEELNLNPKKLLLILVPDDSMSPTLHQNDAVLIDTTQNNIVNNAIYALKTSSNFHIKRIYQKLTGQLAILSDNKIYSTELVEKDQAQITIIGKAIWAGKFL